MMIAIIGASGFVGSALLDEAVRRGHTVTALCRHPENIDDDSELVTAKKADVFNEDALAEILEGHEAVLSAFNAGWDNPNLYQDFLEGSKSIQRAAKKADVGRLLVVGGAGSLEIEPGKQLVDSPDFPEEYKEGAKAARDYYEIIRREKKLDWTFLSPAIQMNPETEHKRTGRYRIGKDQPVYNSEGNSIISVEDLAVALLDELENEDFVNQRFTVGY